MLNVPNCVGVPLIRPLVGPDDLSMIVVEHDGRVVGCWGVMTIRHLEGVWIHPDYRGKASVARRLVAAMFAYLRTLPPRWVMTAANDDAIRRLLTKHFGAQRVPGEAYVIAMSGSREPDAAHL